MKILAWLVISFLGFLFFVEPFLIGKSRPRKTEFYGYHDWVETWIAIGLFLPLCGRVLGVVVNDAADLGALPRRETWFLHGL